jgi:site-specific recombinase XerD
VPDPRQPADDGGDEPRTLDPYIDTYVRERRRRGEFGASSDRQYRFRLRSLSKSFGSRPLSDFVEQAIEEWLETIGEMRPASRRSYQSTVRRFCIWMTRRGHIAADPMDDVRSVREPRSVPRARPKDDVARLLASRPDPRSQLIIWLMVGIGLRCIEVSRLDVSDYDPVARTILVRGKADHERVLPVPDSVAIAIERYLRAERIGEGPLVQVLAGRPIPRLNDVAWLRRRYLEELASAREIAEEIGCARETVRKALIAHGITVRKAGGWSRSDTYRPPPAPPPRPSTGRRVRPSWLSKELSKWWLEAGIKKRAGDGIAAHSLRHTAASDTLDKCNDLTVVQRMLGHSNIATTSRYLRVASLDKMRDAMEGHTYGGIEATPMPDSPALPDPAGATSMPCSLREHLDAGGDLSPMLIFQDSYESLAEAIAFDPLFLTADQRAHAAAHFRELGEMMLGHPGAAQVHVTQNFWLGEIYDDEELRRAAEALLPPQLLATERALVEEWNHPNPLSLELVNAPCGWWNCAACGIRAHCGVPAIVVAQPSWSHEDEIRYCAACIQRMAEEASAAQTLA